MLAHVLLLQRTGRGGVRARRGLPTHLHGRRLRLPGPLAPGDRTHRGAGAATRRAPALAEEAARLAAETDWGCPGAGTLVDLAEVRSLGGRARPGPARSAQQALAIYAAKGDHVSAGRVERALEDLGRGLRFRPLCY